MKNIISLEIIQKFPIKYEISNFVFLTSDEGHLNSKITKAGNNSSYSCYEIHDLTITFIQLLIFITILLIIDFSNIVCKVRYQMRQISDV